MAAVDDVTMKSDNVSQEKAKTSIEEGKNPLDGIVDPSSCIYRCMEIFKDLAPLEETKTLYAEWAATYDKEMASYEYFAVEDTVKILLSYLKAESFDKDITILDIGCGTGAVGRALKQHGYCSVDGLDLCQEMLDVSFKDNIYCKTFCLAFTGDELPIEASSYDIITAVGCIAGGHIKAESFKEMMRLVKPGGLLALVMDENIFAAEMEEFEEGGKLKIVGEERLRFIKLPGQDELVYDKLYICKKL